MASDVKQAQLLTPAVNYAIVQLPGRALPGVVVQGDSFHSIYNQICEIDRRVKDSTDVELKDTVRELRALFRSVLVRYELVLKNNGITLPYVRTEKLTVAEGE